MTNTTSEIWSVDGVSLNQYCWNITTLGGARMALPNLRGEDAQFSFRPGKDFRPKLADSRVLSLAMYVQGQDPANELNVVNQRVQWNENWRVLKRLFWTPSRQVNLVRFIEFQAGLQQQSANVQIAGTMEPSMTGRTRAVFTVDFLMSDPYFYGDPVNVTLPRSVSTPVTNDGDDVVAYSRFQIQLNGPLTNPRVARADGTYVQLNATIANGDSVVLDVAEFTAVRGSDSANLIASVVHAGSRQWLVINPGTANFILTSSAGTGNAKLTYAPPYV